VYVISVSVFIKAELTVSSAGLIMALLFIWRRCWGEWGW